MTTALQCDRCGEPRELTHVAGRDYCVDCLAAGIEALLAKDDRWRNLWGTPERAAATQAFVTKVEEGEA